MITQAGIYKITLYENKNIVLNYSDSKTVKSIATGGDIIEIENSNCETSDLRFTIQSRQSANNKRTYQHTLIWKRFGYIQDVIDQIEQIRNSIYGWIPVINFYNTENRIILNPFKPIDGSVNTNISHHFELQLRNIIYGQQSLDGPPIVPNLQGLDAWYILAAKNASGDLINQITGGANAIYVSGSGNDEIYDLSGLSDNRWNKNAYVGNGFGLPEYYNFPWDSWFYYDSGNPFHWKLKDFHLRRYNEQANLLSNIAFGKLIFEAGELGGGLIKTSELFLYNAEQTGSVLSDIKSEILFREVDNDAFYNSETITFLQDGFLIGDGDFIGDN